jgi:hypothetical protein
MTQIVVSLRDTAITKSWMASSGLARERRLGRGEG